MRAMFILLGILWTVLVLHPTGCCPQNPASAPSLAEKPMCTTECACLYVSDKLHACGCHSFDAVTQEHTVIDFEYGKRTVVRQDKLLGITYYKKCW